MKYIFLTMLNAAVSPLLQRDLTGVYARSISYLRSGIMKVNFRDSLR